MIDEIESDESMIARPPKERDVIRLTDALLRVYHCEGLVVVEPCGDTGKRIVLSVVEADVWSKIVVAAGAVKLGEAMAITVAAIRGRILRKRAITEGA